MRVVAPQDISAGMLRRKPHNLNAQSCDATVMLIQGVLDSGVDVTHVRRGRRALTPDLCRYRGRAQSVCVSASLALSEARTHPMDSDAQG